MAGWVNNCQPRSDAGWPINIYNAPTINFSQPSIFTRWTKVIIDLLRFTFPSRCRIVETAMSIKKSSSFISVTHSIFDIHCVLKFSKLNCDNRFLLFGSWPWSELSWPWSALPLLMYSSKIVFLISRWTRNFVE